MSTNKFKVGDIVRVRARYRLPYQCPHELFRILDISLEGGRPLYLISDILGISDQEYSDHRIKLEIWGLKSDTWTFYGDEISLDYQTLRDNKLIEIGIE